MISYTQLYAEYNMQSVQSVQTDVQLWFGDNADVDLSVDLRLRFDPHITHRHEEPDEEDENCFSSLTALSFPTDAFVRFSVMRLQQPFFPR